ncbi:transposase [Nocardia sp. NPDC004711]
MGFADPAMVAGWSSRLGRVADVARDCGVTDETIRNWVKQFQRTTSTATVVCGSR